MPEGQGWDAVGCAEDAGPTTVWVLRDTSEAVHLSRLFALVPSLEGLWHASGILADAILQRHAGASLGRVYAPKAHGVWSMHQRAAASASPHPGTLAIPLA